MPANRVIFGELFGNFSPPQGEKLEPRERAENKEKEEFSLIILLFTLPPSRRCLRAYTRGGVKSRIVPERPVHSWMPPASIASSSPPTAAGRRTTWWNGIGTNASRANAAEAPRPSGGSGARTSASPTTTASGPWSRPATGAARSCRAGGLCAGRRSRRGRSRYFALRMVREPARAVRRLRAGTCGDESRSNAARSFSGVWRQIEVGRRGGPTYARVAIAAHAASLGVGGPRGGRRGLDERGGKA